jgi:heme A synthase
MNLHRYSLLVMLLALLVILSGAYITSTEVAARQSQSAVSLVLHEGLHRAVAVAFLVLTFGLAIWTTADTKSRALQVVAWSAAGVVIADAALGWHAAPLTPTVGVFHALLAHLLLSLVVVVTVGTSSLWRSEPELVDGSIRPLLRPLVVAIPPTVFLQITLGAVYRHDITSVMPHMAVAMGVALLALIGSSQILQNFPRPAAMRHAAIALISIVLTQVCLGITAFLMLLMNSAGTSYFILVTVGHVAVGAATLAASIVMAMQVWRSVAPGPRD